MVTLTTITPHRNLSTPALSTATSAHQAVLAVTPHKWYTTVTTTASTLLRGHTHTHSRYEQLTLTTYYTHTSSAHTAMFTLPVFAQALSLGQKQSALAHPLPHPALTHRYQ